MSEGIYYLTEKDFEIRQNTKGNLLGLSSESNGMNLILFYSKECKFCDDLLTQFKQLPRLILGCKFSMLNINHYHNVIEMSKNTISPITYVPDLILYVNGLPYMRYDGSNTKDAIKDFIIDIHQKLQKVKFVSNDEGESNQIEEKTVSDLPEYTVGRPLYGCDINSGKCYLDFSQAYN